MKKELTILQKILDVYNRGECKFKRTKNSLVRIDSFDIENESVKFIIETVADEQKLFFEISNSELDSFLSDFGKTKPANSINPSIQNLTGEEKRIAIEKAAEIMIENHPCMPLVFEKSKSVIPEPSQILNEEIDTDNLKTIYNFARENNVTTAYIYKLILAKKIIPVIIDEVNFIDNSTTKLELTRKLK